MERAGKYILKAIPGETLPGNIESLSSTPKPKQCEYCGSDINYVLIPMVNRWILPACQCQVEKFLEDEQERLSYEQRKKIDRLFEQSGLGERFKHCTFKNWIKRTGTEDAYKLAFSFAENIEQNIQLGLGFLIFGNPGNGKSHLAGAVTNLSLKKGYTSIFERVPTLLAKIRATYNRGGKHTEQEIMRALTEADLLVLDDTGAEKCTEWTEPTLYTIIDERYTNKKSLIVTTNSDIEGLEKKIGFRALDRLLEMCEIVENQGSSFRQEIALNRRGEAK